MSEWNLGRVVRVAAAAVYAYYSGDWSVLAQQVVREDAAANASRRQRNAIRDYNAQLKDRLEMFEPVADAPRSLVLGRVRYVEGVRRRWTSGTHDEKLTLIVSFAGHEIDAFEQWYLDDKPVTLDGSGYVNEAPWRSTVHRQATNTATLDGSGGAVLTLTETPLAGQPVVATWHTGAGDNMMQGSASVSVVGTTATVTGGQAGSTVTVVYTVGDDTKRVRIRPYLGAAGQNVGAALAAEYPGKITTTDQFAGMALAVVDLIYDPDVFPQGRPNVTAVMRGAKCLDPRTGTTAWTENPALHAYHYARWESGWALAVGDIRTADVIAAANACDTSTVFTLRDVTGAVSTATLPRFRSGMTISAGADHAASMGELVAAMAGRHGWAGGVWRLRAGTLASTVATVDNAWLVSDTRGGRSTDDPVISAVQSVVRAERFNRLTGSCVDPAQRYQLLPFPAVQDSVLVAAKGRRPLEVQFQAVNHIAHAQHLGSIIIRQAQAGLHLELSAGDQAADLELFDVVAVTMAKYGYSAKTFEVIGWEWGQQGPYKLQLAEITAAMFDVQAELTGRDPAPDSDLRAPWDVEQITGVAVTSGTTAQTDGSILTRTVVSWTPAGGENVRRGGSIEVQYTEATGTLPAGEWPSWVEPGTATQAIIPGLLSGRHYLFRVRAMQPAPTVVRGPWSAPVVRHQVSTAAQDALQADLTAALAAADAAQATADGKIDTFWQATAPSSASEGDIWFDTDDSLKQYRRTSGVWVLAADTRIGDAVTAAADAQATADGKVTTFVSASAPTADAVGDLWLDTDDGNKLYRWSGSAWDGLQVGTGAIAANAATEVTEVSFSSVSVTGTAGTGSQDYNTARWSSVGTISFTAGFTGNAHLMTTGLVSFSGAPSIYVGALACQVWINADFDGDLVPDAGEQLLSDYSIVTQPGSSVCAQRQLTAHQQVAVTQGASYSWPVYAKRLEGTVTIDAITFRIEQIKR